MIPFNIEEKFHQFDEYWTPKIVGELNGQLIKLAKLKGEFVWHSHENEGELFMIVKGTLILEFRDRIEKITKGEVIIVPKGVEHLPKTENNEEVWVLLFEPKATKHTGNETYEMTVKDQQWL